MLVWPQARRLSGPMPSASLGDVQAFRLDSTGEHVLYLADDVVDGSNDLTWRTLASGETRRLGTRPPRSQVRPDFELDPTGRWAVFRDVASGTRWWTVALDGSQGPVAITSFTRFTDDGNWVLTEGAPLNGQPRQISSQPTDGSVPRMTLTGLLRTDTRILEYATSADSFRVVLAANLIRPDRFELYVVPIDGSLPPTILSGGILAGRNVTGFELSDSGHAVYRADARLDEVYELFRVPVDRSAGPVRVSPDLPPGTSVGTEFALTPAGDILVFTADLRVPGQPELFGLRLDGVSSPVLLSRPRLAAPDVAAVPADLVLSADGRFVVYRLDVQGFGQRALFASPVDGSTGAVRLHPELGPGEEVDRVELAADSLHALLLLRGEATQLFSAALDGSTLPRPVHPSLVRGGDVVSFALAGGSVVYRADQELDERLELFSAPVDGSGPALRLHAQLGPDREVLPDFRITGDGRAVGFLADLEADEAFELFVAPVDGSGPPLRASDPAVAAPQPVGNVVAMRVAGERAVYLADQERDEVLELYSVPRDGREGPRRLHPPAIGDVLAFDLTPDARTVVFSGDLEVEGRVQLYAAPVDASSPALDLAGAPVDGGSVHAWKISPDGTRVAYAAEALVAGQAELFCAPLDGGAAPLRLAPPRHRTFGGVERLAFSPDGTLIVFTFDDERRGHFELFAVPSAGGKAPRQLTRIAIPGGDVLDFQVSSDGRRVVYLADQDTDQHSELYTVPVDGSAAPMRLNPAITEGQVWGFALGAGSRVVFSYGRFLARRLASAPLDGSAPAVEFHPQPFQHTIDFFLTPGGTRVLFRQRTMARPELFSAPVDASQAPVRLDGPMSRRGLFQPLFPDEDTAVCYLARQDAKQSGVHVVALDGSRPPRRLEAPGAPRQLSADGRECLVFAPAGRPFPDLYSVPVDGSARARLVSQTLPPGASLVEADFGGARDVLYIVDGGPGGVRELFGSGEVCARPGARRSTDPSRATPAATDPAE